MSDDEEPSWYLECPGETDQRIWRVPLVRRPFRVGRRPGLELTLTSSSVSNDHAEIDHGTTSVTVRDLGSTNGTYLNREQVVGEAVLHEGDVVHFADVEFRLVRGRTAEQEEVTMALQSISLPPRELENARRMGEMLVDRRVTPFFQPIVTMTEGICEGYEALGRGALEGLPIEPTQLFQIAAPLELETRLSEVFRSRAVEDAVHLGTVPLFLNTHPTELEDQQALLGSLSILRQQSPGQGLVLEIHERAIADPESIVRLRGGAERAGDRAGLRRFRVGPGETARACGRSARLPEVRYPAGARDRLGAPLASTPARLDRGARGRAGSQDDRRGSRDAGRGRSLREHRIHARTGLSLRPAGTAGC